MVEKYSTPRGADCIAPERPSEFSQSFDGLVKSTELVTELTQRLIQKLRPVCRALPKDVEEEKGPHQYDTEVARLINDERTKVNNIGRSIEEILATLEI